MQAIKTKRTKIILFIVLLYFFSWLIFPVSWMIKAQSPVLMNILFIVFFNIIPLVFTLGYQKWVCKAPLKELAMRSIANRWSAIGWLYGPAFAILSLLISLLFPSTSLNAALQVQRLLFPLIIMIVLSVTLSFALAFCIEVPLRGFLFKELSHLSFPKKTLFLGLVWGVWQLPFLYTMMPNRFLVLGSLVFTIILTYALNYFRTKAHSLFASSLAVSSFYSFQGYIASLFASVDPAVISVFGISGIISALLLALFLTIYDKYFAKEKVISWEKQ